MLSQYFNQPLINFYPRPLRGGRRQDPVCKRSAPSISIHALCEEGDHPARLSSAPVLGHFYPRPLRGGRPLRKHSFKPLRKFLSTPSARRATETACRLPGGRQDFYPRPLRGGRRRRIFRQHGGGQFLSTPSARRATGVTTATVYRELFLSTPSARRATFRKGRFRAKSRYFYPRPLRGGRLLFAGHKGGDSIFLSTPSARRATRDPEELNTGDIFLSTPSARRATNGIVARCVCCSISIHALCEEGDMLCRMR